MRLLPTMLIGAALGLAVQGAYAQIEGAAEMRALARWHETPAFEELTKCRLRPVINSMTPTIEQQRPPCPRARVAELEAQQARHLDVGATEVLGPLVGIAIDR